MPTRAETAYPRLKNYVTSQELIEIYTPTQQELALANQYTKKGATKLGFLVLLKTFQRLGYFVDSNIVPNAIVSHIIKCAQLLTECEAHLAYTGNNYYPFLWRFYRSHRAMLILKS